MKEANHTESYHARKKRVYETLHEFNLSINLSKRIIYRYPLNLLEKLIKETQHRQSVTPADYFLNGLKRSRIHYGDYRKRDRKKKKRLL
jgi:hypothetical protein